jgi:hypothetical protein
VLPEERPVECCRREDLGITCPRGGRGARAGERKASFGVGEVGLGGLAGRLEGLGRSGQGRKEVAGGRKARRRRRRRSMVLRGVGGGVSGVVERGEGLLELGRVRSRGGSGLIRPRQC